MQLGTKVPLCTSIYSFIYIYIRIFNIVSYFVIDLIILFPPAYSKCPCHLRKWTALHLQGHQKTENGVVRQNFRQNSLCRSFVTAVQGILTPQNSKRSITAWCETWSGILVYRLTGLAPFWRVWVERVEWVERVDWVHRLVPVNCDSNEIFGASPQGFGVEAYAVSSAAARFPWSEYLLFHLVWIYTLLFCLNEISFVLDSFLYITLFPLDSFFFITLFFLHHAPLFCWTLSISSTLLS